MSPTPSRLEKVTCFILRENGSGPELLLIQHPYAGWQFPAGTVETGESSDQAALREAQEETGLSSGLEIIRMLSQAAESFPGKSVLVESTTAYARPDPSSWDWITLPRAIWLNVLQHQNGYTQIQFDELDRTPNSTYTSFAITAWVPTRLLAHQQFRSFSLMKYTNKTPASWETFSDHHTFTAAWFPLDMGTQLIEGLQSSWLPVLFEAI